LKLIVTARSEVPAVSRTCLGMVISHNQTIPCINGRVCKRRSFIQRDSLPALIHIYCNSALRLICSMFMRRDRLSLLHRSFRMTRILANDVHLFIEIAILINVGVNKNQCETKTAKRGLQFYLYTFNIPIYFSQ